MHQARPATTPESRAKSARKAKWWRQYKQHCVVVGARHDCIRWCCYCWATSIFNDESSGDGGPRHEGGGCETTRSANPRDSRINLPSTPLAKHITMFDYVFSSDSITLFLSFNMFLLLFSYMFCNIHWEKVRAEIWIWCLSILFSISVVDYLTNISNGRN